MGNEADRVAGSVKWSIGGSAVNKALTLLTTIVLARLLVPEDFGLVAAAVLALTVFNVLSDLGLTGVLVVRQDLDRAAQGTVLTMLVVAGAAIALILFALAPVIAAVFREERLEDIVRVMAALSAVTGFSWFYDMLLQRELQFGRRFIAVLIRTVVYAVVAVALAAMGAGVWSLVGGQVSGALIYGIVLVVLAPYRIRPRFSPGTAKDALRSGHGFLLQAGATTVQDNLDYLVVGRVLGADGLGVYSMAYRLGEVPYSSVADPVARVTFPAFAQMRHAGQDVGPQFLKSLQAVALLTWPIGLILSAAADPFVRAVFGEQWLAMVAPLVVLGLWAVIRPLETMIGWFLNSLGEASRSGQISTVLLVPLVPALFLAAEYAGTVGVACVVLAHLAVTILLQSSVAHRRLGLSARRQARALWVLVPPAAACWASARAVTEVTAGLPPVASLFLAVAAGACAYGGLVALLQPSLVGSVVRYARRSLAPRLKAAA